MDSDGSISRDRNWLMPSLAIFADEFRGLSASWLVRLWLAGTVVLTLLSLAANWAQLRTAPLIASLLFPYLVFPWFLVIMVLGISPVTGARLDALADGILSRPVTRYEYLVASWLARVAIVLAVYGVVNVPAAVVLRLAKRPVAADDVTWYGVLAALTVVGLVLTFLVAVAFLVGTLLRRPLLSAVVLIFVWFPMNLVLHTFSLEEFSPISLSQALPTLLRTPWRGSDGGTGIGTRDADVQAVADQAARFLSVLSGGGPSTAKPDPEFFARGSYQDFSMTRVVLGYSLPTLAAIVLATLCFCWRDI